MGFKKYTHLWPDTLIPTALLLSCLRTLLLPQHDSFYLAAMVFASEVFVP